MITAATISQDLARELRQLLSPGTLLAENEPLSRRTTLRVGGPADLYVEPQSTEELALVLRLCTQYSSPWMVLGRGSNLLVKDGGIRGVVISLNHPGFASIESDGERLICGAGARMRSIAFFARQASLSGMEFMEGIPGNLGGGLRMNAGAMGSSVFAVAESVSFMTPEGAVVELPAAQIPVEYRSCALLKTNIALRATLLAKRDDRHLIEQRMNECSKKRWTSQPAAPSAGCIFKNCPTIPSGKLVQELGLKGTRRGGAMISDIHGNFIVNDRNATARDILDLIQLVKETACRERGLELHTEVQIVGEDLP